MGNQQTAAVAQRERALAPKWYQRTLAREMAAEFLGTFVLIIFGVGVVAQVVLSGGTAGGYLSINLAWGLAVTMGVYVSAGVSGAHLNPAVTLALAARRKFMWSKVLPYSLAQIAGAFVASAAVFTIYHDALNHFDGGIRQMTGVHGTAAIWATYPQPFLSTMGGVIDQIAGTALLVLLIFALLDSKNSAPAARIAPVLIGAAIVLIGASFGYNAGYAINPARDFGPRLFTALAGWGSGVFSADNHWFWVPMVAPLVGGLLGACVYDLLITALRPGNESGVEA